MSTATLRIQATSLPADLTVSPDTRNPERFSIAVSLGDGEVSGRLDFYEMRFGWASFFEDIAGAWKGWSGEKSWESLDGDVVLTATHDGLGHVSLRVALRPQSLGGRPGVDQIWQLDAVLQLEAGQLEAILRDIRAFENGLSGTAA